jgi:Chalcone isomerase-like
VYVIPDRHTVSPCCSMCVVGVMNMNRLALFVVWVVGAVGLLGLTAGLTAGAVANAAWAQDGPTPTARAATAKPGFAATATVAGTALRLNGTGERGVAWFKAYAAGLYLPQVARSAEQAWVQAGAKRLQLRLLSDLPTAEFVKAMKKGVARNSSAVQQQAVASQQQRFEAQVMATEQVKKGDVIDLDYDPVRGLLFSINGKPRGDVIAGSELFAAVLRSFVGDVPFDDKLKAGLLGLAPVR